MSSSLIGRLGALFFVVALGAQVVAGESFTFTGNGAAATFGSDDSGWKWTGLTTPGAVPRSVAEAGYSVTGALATEAGDTAAGWTLVENSGGRVVFEHAFASAGIALRRIFSFGPATNVLRIETWARSLAGTNVLAKTSLLNAQFAGQSFRETGGSGASFPLFGQDLFVGVEYVAAECHAQGDTVSTAQSPHLAPGAGWTFVTAVVVGWPTPGADLAPGESPLRGAFLSYLDTIRVKPADMELHTNTWWTLPLPFSEQDVVNDIAMLRHGFYDRTGMFFDSYALDLGWSDPRSVWQVDADRFPDGFTTINSQLASLGCKLGLWISPGSAYPEGLSNAWLKSQGYEVTPADGPDGVVACFAKGGRYETTVRDNIVAYARQYGLGHVKLDYMAHTCNVPEHGHPTGDADSQYAIDSGLADVLDSLRAVNPKMALEPLVCGTPPSPWWTMHTPYMLGPDGDDVPYGRVPCPEWMESLITARDVAYRGQVDGWLVPTQALETFDIIVQCPGDYRNMAVMAIGRGRWFISTYLNPNYMKPEDWDFLAGMVRWARANKQYLGNAQMIGGRPQDRDIYGYMFHNADKDIYCLRNPWMEQRTIELPLAASDTWRDLRMLYPRHSTIARFKPGVPTQQVTLAPYETVMLETVPMNPRNRIRVQPPRPAVPVANATEQWTPASDGSSHYTWDGTVTMPEVSDGELCILVNGAAAVKDATCTLSLAGNAVTVTKTGSAGQFAAASGDPVENWTWFRVPVTAGDQSVHIDLSVPLQGVEIGVYVRGRIKALHDTTWTDANPFPEADPDLRNWSEPLSAAKTYAVTTSSITTVTPVNGAPAATGPTDNPAGTAVAVAPIDGAATSANPADTPAVPSATSDDPRSDAPSAQVTAAPLPPHPRLPSDPEPGRGAPRMIAGRTSAVDLFLH